MFTWVFSLIFLGERTNYIAGIGITLLLVGVGLVAIKNVEPKEELQTLHQVAPTIVQRLMQRLRGQGRGSSRSADQEQAGSPYQAPS